MDNLKPMTREESIISGNDLKPLNRHEYYLKYLKGKGGGGGGTAANGIVVRPVTPDEVAGLLPEGTITTDHSGAIYIDVIVVSGKYGSKVITGAYRIDKNVENPYYAIIDTHDTTGTKKPAPIDLTDPPLTINKCSDNPNGTIINLTIDKSFESIVSIPFGIIIPDDVGFTTYLERMAH